MKKILVLLLSLFVISSLTGCRLSNEVKHISSIHSDMDKYMRNSNDYIEKQWNLLDKYENKFVNEVDTEKKYKALSEEIIPEFESFSKDLKKIHYKTDEFNDIHSTFVKGIDKNIEAFHEYKKAYDEKNDEYYAKGDQLIDEANKLYEESDQKLADVAKEYQIEIQFDEDDSK